ncbi:MAG: nuclear transport factor 2 family protein [Sphingomonas taxi]
MSVTPEQLVARAEIADLLHAYCRHADAGDVEGMVACYADDCTSNLFGDAPDRTLHGSGAVRDLLSPLLGKVTTGSHYLSNLEYAFAGADECALLVYMYSHQCFAPGTDVPERERWGRYEVRVRRIGGRWLIQDLRLFAAHERGGPRTAEQVGRPFPPRF